MSDAMHMSKTAQVKDSFDEIFSRLKAGDFASGWPLHEQRWQAESMRRAAAILAQRNFKVPLWLGQEPLPGKTIFIWPEQGHGDVMQFVRYTEQVASLGSKVLLAAHTSTVRLLTQSFSHPRIEVVLDLEEHSYEFDFHCPILSLPLACGTDSLDKIPAKAPYLFAEPQEVLVWEGRIRQSDGALRQRAGGRVGVVWAGGARLGNDAERSLSLSHFAPLITTFKSDEVQFFSLQTGDAAAQLQSAPCLPITDLSADLKDWADTAALIANLDLVIACDTAVAHLAAAMGKQTWILSRFNGCWRWLEGRDDSPWYPTVRLFRQKTHGDWDGVMADVVTALASYNG
jgi:hypothetical protein